MSKEVDERVVEMRFDNKNFEANTKETMGTIEKLKQSLKFEGATKGLENLGKESKKISFDGLSRGIDTVKMKFSAMEVMAVTTLANITNSAVNAGKRIISSLTIDPIKTGLSEYETQINAVQTILANTSTKGTTIDQVNDALDQLNTYADKTIYNFTEMTRNIGTFTAAGVDLETSVSAIQGIANVAAVSGSTAQQASTAMYQLSQALATGTVKLQDWNSVVNAGMGGQVFQDALIRTSENLKTGAKQAIKTSGSFRDSLTKSGWLTTEVLTQTLDQFTMLDTEFNRAKLAGKGYAKEQIDEILKMGETATNAATKVKTFTQLIDTMQEAAQSGWAQTWRLIIGDFEEAKTLFTEASDFFGKVIGDTADSRNKLLSGALNNAVSMVDWENLKKAGVATKELEEALINVAGSHNIAVKQMIKDEGSFAATLSNGWLSLDILKETLKGSNSSIANSTGELSKNLSKFEALAKEVINGKWGNGEKRKKSLEAAGHDYASVQKMVNSMVNGVKINLDDLSDAELETMGYTDKQIKSLKELAKTAEEAGTPMSELIKKLERPTGRELIIDTIRNTIKAMAKVVTTLNGAWRDIFPKTTSEQLYNLIDSIHSLSEMLIMSDGNADKLRRTMRGLFAILDIIRIVVGGGLNIAFTIFKEVLSAMDMNILDVTSNMGDAIVAFRDWIKSNNLVVKGVRVTINALKLVAKAIGGWLTRLKEIPGVKSGITKFNKAFNETMGNMYEHVGDVITRLTEFIDRIKEMDSISLSDIGSIMRDFKDNVLTYVFDINGSVDNLKTTFSTLKTSIVDSVKSSDDTISKFLTTIGNFVSGVKDKLGGFDIGALLAIGVGVGMIGAIKKVAGAITGFTNPLESLSGVLEAFGGKFKADAMEKKASAVLKMATAIAVLAGALYIISNIDKDRLWSSIAAIGVLGAALLVFAKVNSMTGRSLKSAVSASTIVALSFALLVMIKALKQLDGIKSDNMQKNMLYLGELAVGLLAASVILGRAGGSLSKSSLLMVGVAYAIRSLVTSLEKLDELDFQNGDRSMKLLIGMLTSLAVVSRLAGGSTLGSGVGILAIAISIKVLIGAFKSLNKMDTGEIQKSIEALTSIMISFSVLLTASKFAGKNAAKAGLLILSMSFSLLLIARACKKISKLDQSGLKQATKTIAIITAVFGGVIALSNLAGSNAAKAGAMILMMSGAFLALSITMTILSKLDPDGLDRAVDAITRISACFALLIGVTKLAKDVKSTLLVLATTIGILSIALGALSMIESDNLSNATTALTAVIGAFAILVASTALAKSATSTIAILTGTIVALGGMLYLVGQLPVNSALASAGSLSAVMLALSASMVIIGHTKTVSPKAMLALGAMTLVMGAVSGILVLTSSMDTKSSLINATAISTLMLSLAATCLVLGLVGKSAGGALKGALALDAVILIIGGLIVTIGAIFENIDGLENTLDKGSSILAKVGYAIGNFVGSIVGGISAGVMSGLPEIGQHLSDFMDNAAPFFQGIKMVDKSTTTSAVNLAKVLALLTGAEILQGIASFITGDDSMDKFGEDLTSFANAIVGFSEIVKGRIDGESVTAASNAGATLAAFASAIPNSGGLLGKVLGENDLDDFSDKLVGFAKAIAKFSAVVKGNVDGDSVTVAANAGKTLAEFANAIPNAGGLISTIVGENDMATFSTNLSLFATAIVNFSRIVKGEVDETAIKTAADAGSLMVELAKTLPKTGGAIQWLTGQQDLGVFGNQLMAFGVAIVGFSDIVKGKIDSKSVETAASSGKVLAELSKSLPNSDGAIQWITGQKDLKDFGTKLVSFGEAISTFSSTVAGNVDESAVTTAANAGNMLSALANALPEKDGAFSSFFGTGNVSMSDFGSQLVKFGGHLASFSASIVDVDASKMASVTDSLVSILDLSKQIQETKIKDFGSTLSTLAKSGVTLFTDEFVNSSDTVTKAMSSFTAFAIGGLNASVYNFTTVGSNAAQGFVNGLLLKVNDGTVYSAGRSIGEVTLKAAEEALDIHSPSREMYKVGNFTIDGFVNALNNGKTTVSKAATSMMDGFVKQATKVSVVSDYTKGAISQYAKSYVSASKSTAKQTQIATKAMSAYVTKLYEESDAYKEDKANLKNHTKALKALYKERSKIQSSMNKKGNSKSTNTSLKSQLKDVDKQIKAAKKQIVQDGEDIAKSAKKVLADVKKSIKDSVSDYLDLFSVSMDTGIDMFEQTTNSLKSSLDSYIDVLSVAYDSGIQLFEEFNTNGAAKQQEENVKSAQEYLTQASEELIAAKEELAKAQEKSNAVNGRSQILLDEVAEAQARVTAATEAQTEAQTALNDAKKDTSVSDTLKNMESQVKGIEELQKNLQLLGERGINQGLLKQLKALGTSGADQVATFVKMTDAELQKANDLFAKSGTLNATTLIGNFKDQVSNMSKWSSDMKSFSNLNLSDDVKSSLMSEFRETGVESSEYLNVILSMTESQLNEFNKAYKEYLTVPQQVADEVSKTTGKYVNKSKAEADAAVKATLDSMQSNVDGYKDWQKDLEKLSKSGMSDELLASLQNLGIDGAEQVKVFTQMTAAELKKANQLFKESGTLAGQTLIDNFGAKLESAKDWGDNVKKLAKLNLSADVKEALLKDVQEQGIASADYVNAILAMDKTQLKEFNTQYKEYLSIPNTIANEVLAAQASVNTEVEKSSASTNEKVTAVVKKATSDAEKTAKTGGKLIGKNTSNAIVGGLVNGITTGSKQITSTSKTASGNALSGLKSSLSKSKGEGVASNVIAGMIKGFENNTAALKEAAENVAKVALNATRGILDIHSPSREYEEIGKFSILGMTDGLLKYSSRVKDASIKVGESALESMATTISKLSQVTTDNLDAQPTIRPVLDLTEVQNGLSSVDGMFNGQSIGVRSNAIATNISSSMNRNAGNQNGAGSNDTYDQSQVIVENTFHITGNNPKEIATEVSQILQRQYQRKDAVWGT